MARTLYPLLPSAVARMAGECRRYVRAVSFRSAPADETLISVCQRLVAEGECGGVGVERCRFERGA